MNEAELQQLVQIEASKRDCILLRNNSGAFKDETGRLIRFGLGNISSAYSEKIKSSDLIGFTLVRITPEMIGMTIPVFTAIEVKDPSWKLTNGDKRAQAQNNFIQWVRAHGGIAGFVNSLENLRNLLGR